VLDRWEQWNSGVKTFQCGFKRWTYDVVFGSADRAKFIELGTIVFRAPDRYRYRIDTMEVDGKYLPIGDSRADHWLCDGKSIWQYIAAKKQVKEYKLPLELPAGRVLDGPLAFAFPAAAFWNVFHSGSPSSPTPFPFAAHAKVLKQQYYIRVVTPADSPAEIWLEAVPHSGHVAACMCHKLVLIFKASDMSPYALRIVAPNAKDYTVYQFYDIAVNAFDVTVNGAPLSGKEASRPIVPPGWQIIPDNAPPTGQPLPLPGRGPLGDARR
jgi:TIGR03009 family protein